MYLWNTKELALKLKDGELSQAERFKYFFVFIVLLTLGSEGCLYLGETPTVISITESIMVIVITIVGTLLSYKKNKDGNDKEFIDRYVCLSIPLLIKLIVLLIVVYIIYMVAGYIVLSDAVDKHIDSTSWVDVLFTLLFELLFYWRLRHHIGWVSQNKTS